MWTDEIHQSTIQIIEDELRIYEQISVKFHCKNNNFHARKMKIYLKISSVKLWQFCHGLNVLNLSTHRAQDFTYHFHTTMLWFDIGRFQSYASIRIIIIRIIVLFFQYCLVMSVLRVTSAFIATAMRKGNTSTVKPLVYVAPNPKKLKCFSSRLAVVFAQSTEAKC